MAGPLSHIRVLDLSRVLAGPWAGQNLADLGAEVIKIERPIKGDDTRAWGPPFLHDAEGTPSAESAYFLSVNRGKKSVTVDLAHPEGQALIRQLAAKCDVVLENFKVGALAKYGLGYEDLRAINPGLVYCSVTGFGQTGPYAARPGYDFIFQGMGGLMSITGERDNEPGGGPQKVGIAITDVLTGKAPLAIGVIMVVAFMLLLVVFRSLAIAISSIVLNLISVAAAFGFATLVFQHGYGAGLLGIEHQGFVNAWAPLFFFALLFGLSMDYQLFLLAAIRERYEATGDTQRAIREGIAKTGRPITNAALVMIVVFVAFGVTGPIPPTELGVTLALAVFLDATVVRMMLVPSLMGLLGERNWWIPKWLDKRLPHVNFSH